MRVAEVCKLISYIILMIICPVFTAKIGVAIAFEDKKERNALIKTSISFIIGFILGGLYFIGFDLN